MTDIVLGVHPIQEERIEQNITSFSGLPNQISSYPFLYMSMSCSAQLAKTRPANGSHPAPTTGRHARGSLTFQTNNHLLRGIPPFDLEAVFPGSSDQHYRVFQASGPSRSIQAPPLIQLRLSCLSGPSKERCHLWLRSSSLKQYRPLLYTAFGTSTCPLNRRELSRVQGLENVDQD